MTKLELNKQAVLDKVSLAHRTCFDGFLNRDIEELKSVKNILKGLEESSNDLDDKIITVVSLFGPEAKDLRELIALLKIVNELVRIGNDTRTCANKTILLLEESYDFNGVSKNLTILFQITINTLNIVYDALVNNNTEDFSDMYRKVKIEETKSDDICAILEKEIYDQNPKNELSKTSLNLLSIIKKLERSADHITNIAHLIEYSKLGGKIKTY